MGKKKKAPIRRPKRRRPHADKWLRRPKKGGKRPKKGGKRPKKGGKRPKKGKKPSRVSYLLGRFHGLYTVKFPKTTFKFLISNRKITIGKKVIRLRTSTNKRYTGYWTFPFHGVTYYIRFISNPHFRRITTLTIKGKKVIYGKTSRKVVRGMPAWMRVSILLGRFPGLYTVRFPKVTFGFVIAHRRVTIGKKTIKLRPSTNKKYIGWWTFPFHRVT